MHSDAPATPTFTRELESVLRREAARRRRTRRPFAVAALSRLRSVSSMAGHLGAAVVVSTVLLLLSPATLDRAAELPPTAEPPVAGYLAQYASSPTAERTLTFARYEGFEVDVITTYVADRAAHGEILSLRHLSDPVASVPVDHPARGPLFVVIGLTIGDAGTIAD